MNHNKIESLRKAITTSLIPLIDTDYALLDVPNHGNIGDNLIWEGEVLFLQKYVNHQCRYEANLLNWEEDKIRDVKTILFHGGGNWGDLYRMCQDHRLYVINKYHDKRIIVFPQTVWYKNNTLLKQDCSVINSHPCITVCVRDRASFDILSEYIEPKKLLLLPDMAFFNEIEAPDGVSGTVLFLNRTDTEKKELAIIPPNAYVSDWPSYFNNKYLYYIWHLVFEFKNKLSVKLQECKLTAFIVDPAYGLNLRGGRQRYVRKGIKFFSKYETIYTTRLHGLILGVLMNKKMVIVDNKYNKCKNFYTTWLKDFKNIEIVYE